MDKFAMSPMEIAQRRENLDRTRELVDALEAAYLEKAHELEEKALAFIRKQHSEESVWLSDIYCDTFLQGIAVGETFTFGGHRFKLIQRSTDLGNTPGVAIDDGMQSTLQGRLLDVAHTWYGELQHRFALRLEEDRVSKRAADLRDMAPDQPVKEMFTQQVINMITCDVYYLTPRQVWGILSRETAN